MAGVKITVNQVSRLDHTDRMNGNDQSSSGASRNYVAMNKTSLNRRGTDQEIANAVFFLASDLASYITGLYMPVYGGMRCLECERMLKWLVPYW